MTIAPAALIAIIVQRSGLTALTSPDEAASQLAPASHTYVAPARARTRGPTSQVGERRYIWPPFVRKRIGYGGAPARPAPSVRTQGL